MDFLILIKFLQKNVKENKDTLAIMAKLSAAVETNESLQRDLQASVEEKYRLQIELETEQSIAKMVEEERTQYDVMAKELTVAHKDSMELQEQLRRIDLKKLGYYEMLINELRRQQEWKEIDEVFRERMEMHKQMENRHIVKQLRCKQVELQVAVARSKEGIEFVQSNYSKTIKKLEAANDKRNCLTLSMVEGSKNLASLKAEINIIKNQKREMHCLQEKKSKLKARLEKLRSETQSKSNMISTQNLSADETIFKHPQAPRSTVQITRNQHANSDGRNLSTPPTIDPFNPMSFFKTFDFKFEISPAIGMQELEKKKQQTSTAVQSTELRPILKGSDTGNVSGQQDNSRHVHFAESEIDSNINTSSCSSPIASSDNEENVYARKPMNQFDKNTSTLLNNAEKSNESVIREDVLNLLSSDPENSAENLPREDSSVADEGKQESEAGVAIVECQKNKPQGTVLPSTLHKNITVTAINSTKISSQSDNSVKEVFAKPDPPQLFKTPGNFAAKSTATAIRQALDDFLNKPPAETTSTATAIHSNINKQPKKATSKKILDFESMFHATSPQSEEEDLNIASSSSTFKSNELIAAVRNSLQEDDDVIMFSDNDWASAEAVNEDFF